MKSDPHPDKTYNHTALYFQLERQRGPQFSSRSRPSSIRSKSDWGTTPKDGNGIPITFTSLQPFTEWNKIQDDDVKIMKINTKLKELGFKEIDKYKGGEGLARCLKYFQQAGLIYTNGRATPTGKSGGLPRRHRRYRHEGSLSTCKY